MPDRNAPLFSDPDRSSRDTSGKTLPTAAIGVAVALVAIVVATLVLIGNRHDAAHLNQPQPLDPYAAHLRLDQLKMSESTSLSGGKSTFLDGTVTNLGDSTVTGITVQVFFANDEQMPPHLETLPLMLIRTREPYIDTQPVSAAPLAPGESRPFRLIFEAIPENWNTQLPAVHITSVTHR